MVRILSRGTYGDSFLLLKELPFGMLLVDVLLRSNNVPLKGEEPSWTRYSGYLRASILGHIT